MRFNAQNSELIFNQVLKNNTTCLTESNFSDDGALNEVNQTLV